MDIINNFQRELENKLSGKSFNILNNYEIEISNIIAGIFILYVLGIYGEKFDGFDIKPIELNNNILFKIDSTDKIHLADVLLSISMDKNNLDITHVLTTIKQL